LTVALLSRVVLLVVGLPSAMGGGWDRADVDQRHFHRDSAAADSVPPYFVMRERMTWATGATMALFGWPTRA
jgi:hypothetical protein